MAEGLTTDRLQGTHAPARTLTTGPGRAQPPAPRERQASRLEHALAASVLRRVAAFIEAGNPKRAAELRRRAEARTAAAGGEYRALRALGRHLRACDSASRAMTGSEAEASAPGRDGDEGSASAPAEGGR